MVVWVLGWLKKISKLSLLVWWFGF